MRFVPSVVVAVTVVSPAPTAVTFPVIYGYEAGSTASFVLENEGNDTGFVTIALEKGTDSPFEISGDTSIKVAASDKTTVGIA